MTDTLTGAEPTADDTASESPAQETTKTDSAPSSDTKDAKTPQSIPYSRFREVTQQNREYKAQMQELTNRMDLLAKQMPQGANGDSINKQKEAQVAKFKDSYSKADELFADFVQNLPKDEKFTDMLLDALDAKGEKMEDWMFNALLRKQERSAKISNDEIQKATQRNTEMLRNLEDTDFADDPAGFQSFIDFANDAVNDKERPYKGEIDDLYAIFRKTYKRDDDQKQTSRRIAKTSKSTVKSSPKVDVTHMSWDEVVKATLNQ
jgi:hypothetical protein